MSRKGHEMGEHPDCMSPRCGCTESCAVAEAVLAEREACAMDMDLRAEEHANTPDTRAAYRNAARLIRTRSNNSN
jgi:hypothetical protein